MERLNKILANAGVASRRAADALIAAGRVAVNGAVVTTLGTKVDPDRDVVTVDGEAIGLHPELVYVALHKPRRVITAAADPLGRPTVVDLVDLPQRLYPVGRLDGESEGLVLLTNDGELANRITHPSHEHAREYRVKITGEPTAEALQAWREGVFLEDGRTLPAEVRLESTTGATTWLRFVLREGRNRQIRRMVEQLRHRVLRIIRVRMGPLLLGDLPVGAWRFLDAEEIENLKLGRDRPAASRPVDHPRAPRYKPGWARPKARPTRPGVPPGRRRPHTDRQGGRTSGSGRPDSPKRHGRGQQRGAGRGGG